QFSDSDGDEHYSSYWHIEKDDGHVIFDGEITKNDTDDLTKYTLSELYSGYRYIWKVRYGDSKIFSDWSDEASFIVGSANSPPDKPEAQSPSNDERFEPGNPVTLQASTFSDPDGDEHYNTHWYVKKEDGDLVLDLEIIKHETDDLTKYTLSDLSPGYRYIWKVNYGDSKIPSEWSDESSFLVKAKTSPDTPKVVTPLNEEIIPGKTVNLTVSSFSDPDGDAHNATYWRIERADGEMYDEYKNKQAYLEIPNETIPDGFLADGLKYHWSAIYEDSQTQRSISSEKSAFKVGESVDSDPRISINDWKDSKDFRMISFVHWPDNPESVEVFKDVNSDNYHRDFRMGAYNPHIKNYDEFGAGLKVEPGKAMWFIARDKYDISIKGVPVSTEHDIEVELVYIDSEGGDWNMIGCPNNLSYKWDDVKVLLYSDDKSKILQESEVSYLNDENDLIDKKIWQWRDRDYVYYSPGDANSDGDPSLKPNEGYWVKAKQKNVFLKFPHEKGTEPSNQENGKQPVSRTSKLRRTITDSIDKPPSPIGSFSDSSKVEDSSGCFISNAASRSGTKVYSVGAGGIVLIFFGLCAILGFKSPGRDDRK
ncbi:MAG: hypothetical protein GY795_08005, partial [Desulfobacterales bacterium]|nr:hypothetical protein [Desulfobacterales bacterium]